ncbi:MAG: 3-hydroxy-3-methylglutaryl-CoA reductase, partial [Thaumarchaeota archaeon]|nr:3-hydroxy-3-methylglutaryl-CoA reductase [Nitrososphaerota archaeon]
MRDSLISKFFEKSRKHRLDIVKNFASLSKEEIEVLENSSGGITFDNA